MQTFKASVQYNDLEGSVAADRADTENAQKWLRDNNLINDEELVVGITMLAGENHGKHDDPVAVMFLVSDLKGFPDLPSLLNGSGDEIDVKKIRVEMNLTDFFGLFKRLEITLSSGGALEGKTYTSE